MDTVNEATMKPAETKSAGLPETKPATTTATVTVEAPKVAEDKPRRRGRPSKGDGSPSRPPVVKVGEVEFRKPASEINNHYAAFDRIHEQEQALYQRKKDLAKEYEAKGGKKIRLVEPLHPLDGKSGLERMPSGQGKAMAKGLYAAPARLLGVESRPRDEDLDMLGEAIADLSKYYSFESEFMAWAGLAMVASAVFAPAAMELRSKKSGTWDVDKEKFRAAGLLPPVVSA